jgi:large subunit ribosomal protein L35
MPKLRTHKATAKRFRITKAGKVLRPHAQKSHLLTGKSPRRKRQYAKLIVMRAKDAQRVRRAAPYL